MLLLHRRQVPWIFIKKAWTLGFRKPSPTTGRGFGGSWNTLGKPLGGVGNSDEFNLEEVRSNELFFEVSGDSFSFLIEDETLSTEEHFEVERYVLEFRDLFMILGDSDSLGDEVEGTGEVIEDLLTFVGSREASTNLEDFGLVESL